MQVIFSSRDGTKTKPVFTQELLTQSVMRRQTSSRYERNSGEINIKDTIKLEFHGISLPTLTVNPRFFDANLTSLYRNCTNSGINDLNQFERNNLRRRQDLEFIANIGRLSNEEQAPNNNRAPNPPARIQNPPARIPSPPRRIPSPPRNQRQDTPLSQFMSMTGLDRIKAEEYLRNCQGNVSKAFDLFEKHNRAIDDFTRENRIVRARAEALMEVANYDRQFALKLLREE